MQRSNALGAALLASTALAGVGPALAGGALPTGGSVASGGVSISSPNAHSLSIRQSTQSAIVNWQGFSIGQGNTVNIHQPSSSTPPTPTKIPPAANKSKKFNKVRFPDYRSFFIYERYHSNRRIHSEREVKLLELVRYSLDKQITECTVGSQCIKIGQLLLLMILFRSFTPTF